MKNLVWMLLLVVGLCGCSTVNSPKQEPLKVGITPNYPPMIFSQNGKIAGLEADLMQKLGRELGRPVAVMSLPWDEQVDALIAGKIDIIMSGMSITQARRVKINFTDPWMRGGLLAMMNRSQADKITTVDQVLSFRGNIGVLANTTAHDFVRRSCPNARIIKIASPADAGIRLKQRTIDLFIHDIPSIAWQVASNEADLVALLEPLNKEDIAWGVRLNDTVLVEQVNQVLRRWQADGTLNEAIMKWVPYYAKIK
jgi:ABC-type amino acid transport substrate-binding protein